MRRTPVILSAALMLLVAVPATAVARHEHKRHHSRVHHSRVHHARVERFGRDAASTSTTSSSAAGAGTVRSLSDGVLTVALTDGTTVSGMVTRDTELECTAPAQAPTAHEDGDRGGDGSSGDGDHNGGGEDQNENDAAGENEMENGCSSANLTPGAVVREAALRISNAGTVWTRVELGS